MARPKPGKAFLILNPAAGSGKLKRNWNLLSEKLRSHVASFDFAWTSGPGEAARLAAQALGGGYDYIISVGGDGTLSECLNGFLSGDRPRSPKAALGLLPFGRGSDFARMLGIPRDPLEAMAIFSEPKIRVLDAGKASFTGPTGKTETRYFINIANVGIVSTVVDRARRVPKLLGANASYVLGALKGIWDYTAHEVVCSGIDGVSRLPLLNMVIANGVYFGSGMKIAPRAKPDDGKLDVLTVRKMGLADFLRHMPALYTGEVLKIPQVHYSQNARVELKPENPAHSVPVELDGDTVGTLPARFEVLPRAVRFIVP